MVHIDVCCKVPTYPACSLESQIREATLFMLNVKLYSVTRINWFSVCWHNKRSYSKTNVEYQCKLFINSLLSKFATVKSYHSGTFGLWIASKSLGLFLEDKATEQKNGELLGITASFSSACLMFWIFECKYAFSYSSPIHVHIAPKDISVVVCK